MNHKIGIFAEIAALEHRRDKTDVIRQGVMQQLLSGKVGYTRSVGCLA